MENEGKHKKRTRRGKRIKNSIQKMKFYYCNIRGLKSKLSSIKEIIDEIKPTIAVLVVETWMDPKEKVDIGI